MLLNRLFFTEGDKVVTSQEPFELDLPSLKVVVDELQRRLKEEENPAELEEYRKAFKKLVPLFMRSYVAGYLLRQVAAQGRIRRKMNTITLFLSIGKNRRVYPRDLVQLLFSAGQVSKADIGDIKILDNYSFVEVEEKIASAVIGRLDGIQYRGRNLTVNFAKKRSAEDVHAAEKPRDEVPEEVLS
jgi:ATP-dependent RNA helicase DeaD